MMDENEFSGDYQIFEFQRVRSTIYDRAKHAAERRRIGCPRSEQGDMSLTALKDLAASDAPRGIEEK